MEKKVRINNSYSGFNSLSEYKDFELMAQALYFDIDEGARDTRILVFCDSLDQAEDWFRNQGYDMSKVSYQADMETVVDISTRNHDNQV